MKRWFLRVVVAAGLAGIAGAALAQQSGLPPQLLENVQPLQGDTIRFCIDRFSTGAEFDKSVSQAIADALLVKAKFVDAPTGFPLDGQGYFDELQLTMNEDCDVLAGISILPDTGTSLYPDWATVTRPYAQVPFVLVTTNEAYKNLGDIEPGKTVGVMIGSLGQGVVLTYNSQVGEAKRLKYLPYADPKLMLKRLLDGHLVAMVIWQPQLNSITNDEPKAEGLRTIPLDPLPAINVAVGDLVSSRDSYLRTQIDNAIGSLVADGTIAKLMQEHGYSGTPGP
jgi:polar amino acid transport system substrate-binding protein